jgi:hypothetical protein
MIDHAELLTRARSAVAILKKRGCAIIGIRIDGSLPLIEIDRPPMEGPAMIRAVRGSAGRTPRHVYVAEILGCRVEAPARARGVA